MCIYVIIGLRVGCFIINVKSLTFNDTIIIASYYILDMHHVRLHGRESPVKISTDLVRKTVKMFYRSIACRFSADKICVYIAKYI